MLRKYDPSIRELKCQLYTDDKGYVNVQSNRELGPGEPNIYMSPFGRIEASTNPDLKLPRPSAQMLFLAKYNVLTVVKVKMTTYLHTYCPPDEHEIDEFLENGKLFLGLATTSGSYAEGEAILIEL